MVTSDPVISEMTTTTKKWLKWNHQMWRKRKLSTNVEWRKLFCVGNCGCLRSCNSYELLCDVWCMETFKSATYILCAWVKRRQQAKRINSVNNIYFCELSSSLSLYSGSQSQSSPIRIHNSHSSDKLITPSCIRKAAQIWYFPQWGLYTFARITAIVIGSHNWVIVLF